MLIDSKNLNSKLKPILEHFYLSQSEKINSLASQAGEEYARSLTVLFADYLTNAIYIVNQEDAQVTKEEHDYLLLCVEQPPVILAQGYTEKDLFLASIQVQMGIYAVCRDPRCFESPRLVKKENGQVVLYPATLSDELVTEFHTAIKQEAQPSLAWHSIRERFPLQANTAGKLSGDLKTFSKYTLANYLSCVVAQCQSELTALFSIEKNAQRAHKMNLSETLVIDATSIFQHILSPESQDLANDNDTFIISSFYGPALTKFSEIELNSAGFSLPRGVSECCDKMQRKISLTLTQPLGKEPSYYAGMIRQSPQEAMQVYSDKANNGDSVKIEDGYYIISEPSFKITEESSDEEILVNLINNNLAFFNLISFNLGDFRQTTVELSIAELERLGDNFASDSRCQISKSRFEKIKSKIPEKVFQIKFQNIVSKNPAGYEEENKLAKSLEAAAIAWMHPEVLADLGVSEDERGEFHQIFNEKNEMMRLRNATKWLEDRYLSSRISKYYDDNVNKLNKDVKLENRSKVLRFFIEVSLKQLTKSGDIDRIFNRSAMGLDKIVIPDSLVELFKKIPTVISACDSENTDSLENAIINLIKKSLKIVLQELQLLFPDPVFFDGFTSSFSDLEGSSLEQRNTVIAKLMAMPLSNLINKFSAKNTLQGQVCSVIAERANRFLVSAPQAAKSENYYTALEKEIDEVFDSNRSEVYALIGLQKDEEGVQVTCSAQALSAATANALEINRAEETLAEILAFHKKIPDELLVSAIADLWITVASEETPLPKELMSNVLEKLPKLFAEVFAAAYEKTNLQYANSAKKAIFSTFISHPQAWEGVFNEFPEITGDLLILAYTNARAQFSELIEKLPYLERNSTSPRGQIISNTPRSIESVEITYEDRLLEALKDEKQELPRFFDDKRIQNYLLTEIEKFDFADKGNTKRILKSNLQLHDKLQLLAIISQNEASQNRTISESVLGESSYKNFCKELQVFLGPLKKEDVSIAFTNFLKAKEILPEEVVNVEHYIQRSVLIKQGLKTIPFPEEIVTPIVLEKSFSSGPGVALEEVKSIHDFAQKNKNSLEEASANTVALNPVSIDPSESAGAQNHNKRALMAASTQGNIDAETFIMSWVRYYAANKIFPTLKDISLCGISLTEEQRVACKEKIKNDASYSIDQKRAFIQLVDEFFVGEKLVNLAVSCEGAKNMEGIKNDRGAVTRTMPLEALKTALSKFQAVNLSQNLFGSHPTGMKEIIRMIEDRKPSLEILLRLKALAAEKNKQSSFFDLTQFTRTSETRAAYRAIDDFFEKRSTKAPQTMQNLVDCINRARENANKPISHADQARHDYIIQK